MLWVRVPGKRNLGERSVHFAQRRVKSVINYSLRRVILTATSRAYTRARNHTPVLTVVKTFLRKFISYSTCGVCIKERSPISVLSVEKVLVIDATLPDIFEVYTVEFTSNLLMVKLLPISITRHMKTHDNG